jgi:hypothetical protein
MSPSGKILPEFDAILLGKSQLPLGKPESNYWKLIIAKVH